VQENIFGSSVENASDCHLIGDSHFFLHYELYFLLVVLYLLKMQGRTLAVSHRRARGTNGVVAKLGRHKALSLPRIIEMILVLLYRDLRYLASAER